MAYMCCSLLSALQSNLTIRTLLAHPLAQFVEKPVRVHFLVFIGPLCRREDCFSVFLYTRTTGIRPETVTVQRV